MPTLHPRSIPLQFHFAGLSVTADDYVRLGMSYDCFTRTTTRNHYAIVEDMFRKLYDEGFLIDLLNTTYNFLDLTAKGRDEDPEASQDWVRYHDRYEPGAAAR